MCKRAVLDVRQAFISEELCIGCGICVKKCPFEAIDIINLPKNLEPAPAPPLFIAKIYPTYIYISFREKATRERTYSCGARKHMRLIPLEIRRFGSLSLSLSRRVASRASLEQKRDAHRNNTTHRYGPNSFKLHRLPTPRARAAPFPDERERERRASARKSFARAELALVGTRVLWGQVRDRARVCSKNSQMNCGILALKFAGARDRCWVWWGQTASASPRHSPAPAESSVGVREWLRRCRALDDRQCSGEPRTVRVV